ncbi:glycohydrolase toxin TNT-related protein [Leifsonia sp. NPDC056665]|uniref:glycohydrolase toxin TNT-related protein n=1 Tax=Leifsonia sp. NPDC056665 TaxID=3345901 RepID=UPI0036AC87E4
MTHRNASYICGVALHRQDGVEESCRMGRVAPGFGQPGNGIQFYFPYGIDGLVADGYLGVVK